MRANQKRDIKGRDADAIFKDIDNINNKIKDYCDTYNSDILESVELDPILQEDIYYAVREDRHEYLEEADTSDESNYSKKRVK